LTLGGQNTSGVNTFSGNFTLGVTANTGKSVTCSPQPAAKWISPAPSEKWH
jgi:hypothetical protein